VRPAFVALLGELQINAGCPDIPIELQLSGAMIRTPYRHVPCGFPPGTLDRAKP
jgi:hypothetical protein